MEKWMPSWMRNDFDDEFVVIDDDLNAEDIKQMNHMIVEERNRDIKKIEEDVQSLNEVNQILTFEVYNQGESIRYIDDAFDNITNSVDNGTEALHEADEQKKSYRNGIIAGALTLGASVLAAASIYVWSEKRKEKQINP